MNIRKSLVILALAACFNVSLAQQTVTSPEESLDSIAADLQLNDSVAIDSLLPWEQAVAAKLDRCVQSPLLQTTQAAIMVWDLDADSAIYCFNHRQLMRPASTEKLLTAITAIDRLGGSYQFKTELAYTGSIDNHTLNGDLHCIGGMDPRFNGDDLNAFVESVRRMGIDTIRGGLVADRSFKESATLGEGWCWDDDNPVLSPLLINREDNLLERFEALLLKAHITIIPTTTTKPGRRAPVPKKICTRFHTIDQILMKMMKDSDNLYAESMFYQIAAADGNRPATAKNTATIIKRLITKLGLDASQYYIADGSGLSLYNYVSAELETMFLRHAFRNEKIFIHLYPSLPIAGVDGTLKNRMKHTFTQGNVRAKTGTLSRVISLAGYCKAANGHNLCFAILNQGIPKASMARAFQDRVCQILCEP
ncbi:MAG: D-alanyl-D-alanine carboxypeptidase/D-alanyl-D-alanine-endopeptidase [Prevotella sp.]|nr:D-alanyl-D-alanine carboxypeptidase/D-alanyl-D-alanine-endopeptidase [Prevotella sp.]